MVVAVIDAQQAAQWAGRRHQMVLVRRRVIELAGQATGALGGSAARYNALLSRLENNAQ
ncbi:MULTISPECIES: hypothetical protein [unclassified Pseudomonas]|uniref:hypothetical protein n=1 Tax=unclassified Pseudomonas TaxID=196821 RepID=UPI0014036481|nr:MULTISPECIES: hypothetical protein [unclassified Pseudomonas]